MSKIQLPKRCDVRKHGVCDEYMSGVEFEFTPDELAEAPPLSWKEERPMLDTAVFAAQSGVYQVTYLVSRNRWLARFDLKAVPPLEKWGSVNLFHAEVSKTVTEEALRRLLEVWIYRLRRAK